MRTRHLLNLLLAVVLLAFVAGCGRGGDDGDEPTAEPTVVASTGSTPSGSGGSGSGSGSGSSPTAAPSAGDDEEIVDLNALTSYRAQTLMAVVGEEDEKSWEILVEYTSNPPARHTYSKSVDGGKVEEFEIIQVDNVTYMQSGGEWFTMTSDDLEDSMPVDAWMLEPGNLNEDCRQVGTETVNGYQTRHYTCDLDAVAGGAIAGYAALGLVSGELQDGGAAEMWVSTQHDIPVRSRLTYKVKSEEGEITEVTFETNLSSVNEPIEILAPEGVEPPGLPQDVPVMEGAEEVASFMGMTSFTVPQTADQTAEWYKEAMEAQGWTLDEASSAEGMYNYRKAGRIATLYISESDGEAQVVIMVSEE